MSYKAVIEARKSAEEWAKRVNLKEAIKLGLQLRKERIEKLKGEL